LGELIVFVQEGLGGLLSNDDFFLVSLLLTVVSHELVVLGGALFGGNEVGRVVYIIAIAIINLAYL